MKEIPFGRPVISQEEKKKVLEVLDSAWLTHGPNTKDFEAKFKDFCGAKHAVGVNSGTAALHLGLLCEGIGPGDEVIVPAQTHVATAHAVMYVGAKPVFTDVEVDTYNIDINSLKEMITEKTKAIMPVHFAGQPCKMKEIYEISKDNNLAVVEDAAHAPGAEYGGKKIGSFEESSSASFSFYPVKHITTGEGGMLVTNNEKIAEKANLLRAFGIDKSTWKRTKTERPWFYLVDDLGFNYRMTEISAAMGIGQLDKINSFTDARIKNAMKYESELQGVKGINLPQTIPDVKHAYLFYQILVNDESKTGRDVLIGKLKEKGIGTSVHYPVAVPLMPVYKRLFGFKEGTWPNAEKIAKEAISLPVHPGVSEEDVVYVCDAIKELVQ
jgi:dTDP-4-amino-4,6-dideoxygalactose transaminase